jgi:hypothetical protein
LIRQSGRGSNNYEYYCHRFYRHSPGSAVGASSSRMAPGKWRAWNWSKSKPDTAAAATAAGAGGGWNMLLLLLLRLLRLRLDPSPFCPALASGVGAAIPLDGRLLGRAASLLAASK